MPEEFRLNAGHEIVPEAQDDLRTYLLSQGYVSRARFPDGKHLGAFCRGPYRHGWPSPPHAHEQFELGRAKDLAACMNQHTKGKMEIQKKIKLFADISKDSTLLDQSRLNRLLGKCMVGNGAARSGWRGANRRGRNGYFAGPNSSGQSADAYLNLYYLCSQQVQTFKVLTSRSPLQFYRQVARHEHFNR